MIGNFLLFNPFSKLPLISLDSEVKGFPSFNGGLTSSSENILFPANHMKSSIKPVKKHRDHIQKLIPARVAGTMFVLGNV